MSAWDLRTLVPEKSDIWLISGYFTKLFERLDGPEFSIAIKNVPFNKFQFKMDSSMDHQQMAFFSTSP